mgnify:FL=1
MKQIIRRIFITFTALAAAILSLQPAKVSAAERLQHTKTETTVIVIDPGHGGENEGTIAGTEKEKYMTMTTARAMYEELSLYDNVEVYLTHTEDVDMKLEERAEFAKNVNADFLFSIHYNASEYHELFGSEIWVPLNAPFNNYGYQFGYEFLSILKERGLFLRGIKTRVGDKGLDYYGIIRFANARDIPAVILEHCHVDEERDTGFCDSEDDLIRFGKDDATAVAKYFGLKSSILNVDYSDYQLQEVSGTQPVSSTLRDDTAPDVCQVALVNADYSTGQLSVQVNAADYDSPLIYYDYSLDGGLTFSPRNAWPDSDALSGTYADTFTLNLSVPSGVKPTVIVRAYNLFDLFTASNAVEVSEAFHYGQDEKTDETESTEPVSVPGSVEAETSDTAEPASAPAADNASPVSFATFLIICFIAVGLFFVLLGFSQLLAYRRRKRRRAQRRKDEGQRRNHNR